MRTILALFLMFPVLQDDIGELIDKLESESIEERSAAAEALVSMGEEAGKELRRRLPGLEGEVKARVEDVLRKIEQEKARAQSLPPLRRVTLEAEKRKLRDVLLGLQSQTGLPIDLEDAGDAEITVSVKDATPLEALTAVCKAADLTFDIQTDHKFDEKKQDWIATPPMVQLRSGFVDYPRQFVRHYQVRVNSITLNRTQNFRETTATGQVNLMLLWTPDLRPDAVVRFEVKSVVDDKGRTLFEAKDEEGWGGVQRIDHGRDWYQGSVSAGASIPYPEADARKLASVKGRAVLRYPGKKKVLLFEDPSERIGETRELQGLTVKLEGYQETEDGAQVKLVVTGTWEREKHPEEPSGGWGDNFPFGHEDVHVRTEDGSTLRSHGMSASGSQDKYEFTLNYGRKGEKVTAIEIECSLDFFYDSFEFELKDIALPK